MLSLLDCHDWPTTIVLLTNEWHCDKNKGVCIQSSLKVKVASEWHQVGWWIDPINTSGWEVNRVYRFSLFEIRTGKIKTIID